MSVFNERLKALRQSQDLTLEQLGSKLGLSKSSVNMYERGEREPSFEILEKIADYFNVDIDYLLGKSETKNKYRMMIQSIEESPLKDFLRTLYPDNIEKQFDVLWDKTCDAISQYSQLKSNYPDAISAPVRIPVLGSVPAGIPIEAVEDIIDYEEISDEMARDGDYFALRIRGNSMEPKISDGDVVIVRKQETVENGQIAVVMINGDDATVKKFYDTGAGITLVGLNPTFEPLTYTPDQVAQLPLRVIGRVVELRAKF